jgi:hypothetical protein
VRAGDSQRNVKTAGTGEGVTVIVAIAPGARVPALGVSKKNVGDELTIALQAMGASLVFVIVKDCGEFPTPPQ